ncbi:MAG: peptidoglycan editing factor PgeF [Campylobacteraceae bacterium]|jgi:YfiH family protein|nr:peptidoglycan editing factor PgeF [Campylobacteraceae bacterium]
MREVFTQEWVKIIASDRAGGVSADAYESLNLGFHVGDKPLNVEKNREIFASYFDVSVKELCFMEQIHGSLATMAKKEQTLKTDALITQEKNLVLCVMVADCVPVILYDNDKKAAAAVHAGRKGIFSDIISNTVLAMKNSFKSSSKDIGAYIGVSIRSCCYEIQGEILNEAKDRFSYALSGKEGRHFLSLQTIVKKQLHENGVVNIIDENVCSCCDKNYFSYRREGVCGRFAVGVKIV